MLRRGYEPCASYKDADFPYYTSLFCTVRSQKRSSQGESSLAHANTGHFSVCIIAPLSTHGMFYRNKRDVNVCDEMDTCASVLKREHCLSKIRKRGIPAVTEECLLSAMALNLKRMVRAILLTSHMLKIGAESIHFLLQFIFCQQVPYLTLSNGGGVHADYPI